ncbi:MAG: hypothetical protein IM618_04125 [Cytophagales bacterium]|nr:hypothetical protein [Cytophagales bacterium]
MLREQKWIDLDAKYRYGYQGQYSEHDKETGWEHFELREWDNLTGRWMVPDPEGQHWSPYMGMGNDPINSVDEDGGQDDVYTSTSNDKRTTIIKTNHGYDRLYIDGAFAGYQNKGWGQSIFSGAKIIGSYDILAMQNHIYEGQAAFMDHPVTQGAIFGLGFFTGGSEAYLLGRVGTGLRAARGPVRLAYEKTVKELAKVADDMLSNGYTKEATAKSLHYLRRRVGVIFKEQTPVLQRGIIYIRNYLKYGDKLGPSFHRLRQSGKSFDDIIESASRPGGKDLFK